MRVSGQASGEGGRGRLYTASWPRSNNRALFPRLWFRSADHRRRSRRGWPSMEERSLPSLPPCHPFLPFQRRETAKEFNIGRDYCTRACVCTIKRFVLPPFFRSRPCKTTTFCSDATWNVLSCLYKFVKFFISIISFVDDGTSRERFLKL